MKVILCDESHYEVFLNEMEQKDFEAKEFLEDYFKSIFRKLHKDYHLEINGYYEVNVYQDCYYGMVLEIRKEEIDYYDFSMNEVDMRIQIESDSHFLYEIEDCFVLNDALLKKGILYTYQGHFYFSFQEKPTLYEIAYLLERSHLIYKNTSYFLESAKLIDYPVSLERNFI